MLQFTEKENTEKVVQVRRTWWGRYWKFGLIVSSIGFGFFLVTAVALQYEVLTIIEGTISFISSLLVFYFFYKFVAPPSAGQKQREPRTIKDILVLGSSLRQIKDELHLWIADQKIVVESERDDFFRGRLGNPSGFGITPPLYFEVSIRTEQNGIIVHTEGWVSMFSTGENNFAERPTLLSVPRKKGWKVMIDLWTRLEVLSK